MLPLGARDDRPDYEYADGVTLRAYELADGASVTVTVPDGAGEVAAVFEVVRAGGSLTATRRRGGSGWGLASGANGPPTTVPPDADHCSIEV